MKLPLEEMKTVVKGNTTNESEFVYRNFRTVVTTGQKDDHVKR